MLEPRRPRRFAACFASLLTPALVAACVAQEPYREPPGISAGSGGKAASGDLSKGGLELVTSGAEAAGSTAAAGGDAATGASECRTSAQCFQPNPFCLGAAQRCVECLSRVNCVTTGLTYCDPGSHTCVACLDDTHCKHDQPYCDSSGQCVECLSNANCGDAGLLCDHRSFRCVPRCVSNQDCAASARTPFCDPDTSLCVSCLAEADCALPEPHCAAATHRCVQCLENADCQPGVSCVAGACLDPK